MLQGSHEVKESEDGRREAMSEPTEGEVGRALVPTWEGIADTFR